MTKAEGLASDGHGLWRWTQPGSQEVVAGLIDADGTLEHLRASWPVGTTLVSVEQVHGASIASAELRGSPELVIAGCDGLVTSAPHVALTIRTADCLPIALWDRTRRVVALVHAGWRGLFRGLPRRCVWRLREQYGSAAEDLHVAIGPAIHACCYEVGREFPSVFGAFSRQRSGRILCDLIGYARCQLREAGLRDERITDSGICTACAPGRWYSVRRDGQATGRLMSYILLAEPRG